MAELFGLYVHWPFCKAKCPYCDFNSHVAETIDHQAWAAAYRRELDYIVERADKNHLTSIFFGGGTPSLMQPETVAAVIDHAQKLFQFSNDIEITLEANPTSIEVNKFQGFRSAGINRVSVGVQAINDEDLKFLGREHSAAEAIRALGIANDVFDRVSYDLIYARPEQDVEEWEKELVTALGYASGHLSLYQLTIEAQTPFYTQYHRGDFLMPSSDQAGKFYEVTQATMSAKDMPAYEVSNHAKEGQESVHNLAYWRYDDYIGIGPGAHGRVTMERQKFATRTHRAPEVWMEKVSNNNHGYHDFENIDPMQQVTEMLMMGLRLREGVKISEIKKKTGLDLYECVKWDKIETMAQEGFLEIEGGVIRPTEAGLQRLNSLLSYLL
ncbi:MAG: radical SAM family heme chaperone HemW [Pseudomonadota bacterium]